MLDTIALSECAVAVLRFRVKGWRFPVRDQDRAAFQELVTASIMEPDGAGDYRFTEDGSKRREEILRAEGDRIERERYEPPDASHLSEAARELLRRHLAGEREVSDANRAAYRELAAARIMIPVSGFATGPESRFLSTYWGWHRRHEFAGMACMNENS